MAKHTKSKLWIAILCIVGLLSTGGYLWIFTGLPAPDDLSTYTTAPSSKILDRNGKLLFEIPPPYTGSHTPITLAEVPQSLQRATIATEDATFYTNPGMDGWAIVRSLWINIQGGEVLAGGSTITQQLVRNLLFTPEERTTRTLRRKLRELVLAIRITRRYTKDEILELYLNEIYYGNMAYGVEAAAQAYFGKSVRNLDLAECAMLAGLPQTPALYNPLEDLKAAKERQAIVLDLMVKQGYITSSEAELAKEEKLYFAATPFPIRAPHFVMAVRSFLEQELGLEMLEAGGLTIHTTLDVDLNDTATGIMRHHLELLAECHYEEDCQPGGHNVRNAAIVALDPQTGEVLALVGSPDYFSARIDGAVNGTTALRQPGSSIKPLTYAAAFEQRTLTPGSVMLDVRTAFVTREGAPYVPLNYDLQFRGPVRLREALASSYNLIAVKVLDTIGIDALINLSRRVGITTFNDPDRLGLAITLGGGEVRLLELAATYAAFANGGHRTTPIMVQYVEDATGNTIWESACSANTNQQCMGPQVLDPRITYLITSILSDDMARIPTFGENSVLYLPGRTAAAKTGTTTDFRDNWTVGYTPSLVVGVWTGNADNEPMHEVTGVSGAAPIWHAVMETALENPGLGISQYHVEQEFPRPEGLVEVDICALSGKLPGPYCEHHIKELFIAGTEPTETCDMHQLIDGQIYTIYPPGAKDWAREHHIDQPSQEQIAGETEKKLFLTNPDTGAVYRIDPAIPRQDQRIAISAESGAVMAEVTLLVDGEPLAEFTESPYTVLWPLEAGEHHFSAVGTTADGQDLHSPVVSIQVIGDSIR